MFKSVFIKNFRIIFICFCFIWNKCYSEDCCEICYNCCCNCLNSEEENNENEENEFTKKIDGEFNKIPKIIDSIQNIKLKTLLEGLLTKLEKDRWGWDDILDSGFYKELQKNIREINYL